MLLNDKVMFDGYFCINSAKIWHIIVVALSILIWEKAPFLCSFQRLYSLLACGAQ